MALIDPFTGLTYNWTPESENYAADMDDNLKTLGVGLQLTVEAKTVSDPATLTPTNGQAWIVAATAVGAWSSQEDNIAAYIEGAWFFLTPKIGWKAYIVAEDSTAIFKGDPTPAWTNNPNGGGSINNGENLGASGEGIFASINADKLTFKKLIAGSGIVLSSDANSVSVTASASGAAMELNSQTGTTYTLVLTDAGKAVEMNNASANTLTIPPEASVNFGIGATILVRQMGAGVTTIAPGSGVTIRNPRSTLDIAGQYGAISLHKRASDEWCIEGNMAEGA